MKKQMTVTQIARLNKSISNEQKMYKAWLKSVKTLENSRKK